ncbi:MAG TPA: MmgE/PrpD family protein [Streptosporangiaceae bacterium]
MSERTYTEILADFSLGLTPGVVPPDVLRQAELSTLDFLGVALAGSSSDAARAVTAYVLATGGAEQATVIGTRTRVPMALAGLANGTMGHSIELDDHEAHHRSKVHPGVVVMPAAWAASELLDVSGAQFLTAVVLGYDIIGRLSAATPYPNYLGRERGLHTTPLFGPFAAGAVAAYLLGLTREQIVNMYGIIGSMASGLSETVSAGSMVKSFHAGWAAHGGILAAELARHGVTGPPAVLEGKRGFYRAFCGEGQYDLSVIDAKLAEEFDISLIMYKPYACAGGIHPALTAVDELRREHDIRAADVTDVLVLTHRHAHETFAEPRAVKTRPATGHQAQFSLPYAVAALLAEGAALTGQFTDAAVTNPETLRLAELVRVEVGADLPQGDPGDEPARVVITLTDGRILSSTVPGGKGSLTVPMSADELTGKFQRLAAPVIGAERAEQIEAVVSTFRSAARAGRVIEMIRDGLGP